MAFVLRILTIAAGSCLSLVWARVLLQTMGVTLYGLFAAFQPIPKLGGLGDLGISGAVGIRTGQMIGRNETERLARFLGAARALFLILATLLCLGFFALSPQLPVWLHFEAVAKSGSLPVLFQAGAVMLFVTMAGGYVHSVNAGANNIVWPIIPSLVLGQLALAGQWLLAMKGAPLWAQEWSYILTTVLNAALVWWLLKLAHPELAKLRPVRLDFPLWRELLTTGGWFYLYTLGNLIFSQTDRLLVNAGFGPAAVPAYLFNYKPCEMAMLVVTAAVFASQTKINQWIANPAEASQARARQEVQRLSLFQSMLGTVCALGYLALNNLFIRYWVGTAYQMSPALQWAFAFNLVITAGGDAGIQMAGLCGARGLRTAGLAIGLTGLLNLGLSYAAMRMGSVPGIAWATVVAQTALSLFLGWHTCRHLKLPLAGWYFRSWLLPVTTVGLAAVLQGWIGSKTWAQAAVLGAIFGILTLGHAVAVGLKREFIRAELATLRGCLRR